MAREHIDSGRVVLDQNGAEELTPPGQAFLVRDTETLMAGNARPQGFPKPLGSFG
jgi:hypothetical protein